MNKYDKIVKEIKILNHFFKGTAFENISYYSIRKIARKRLK